METKRYNVVITGRVQDVGFRDFVEKLANLLTLRGYIFNDANGSVRIIVEGRTETVNSFLEDIKSKAKTIGAKIDSLIKHEISPDFDLPSKFIKIPSAEYEELGRKLDKGINILMEIKFDTTHLKEVRDILRDISSKV